ncbi:ubiquitin--protein ligase [Helicobacter sp. 12S02232-10]|nr:ubiquitin--protein ligase [Helicobacter sp. 12S02232-10]
MFRFLFVICIATSLFGTQLEDTLKHRDFNGWHFPDQRDHSGNPYYYVPDSKGKYLGTSAGILGVGLLVGITGLYLMPESVTNWDRERFGFRSWLQDVKIAPAVDDDNFWLNGVAHPYFGAVYYMQPRMAGYSWAESALFSFVTSAFFWEYGIEAFVEIPSWQDLIYTPAMGSIFGEAFYQLTRYIQSNQGRLFGSRVLGYTLVALMDPIGFVIRDLRLGKLFGVKNKNELHAYASPLGVSFSYRF